MRPSTSSDRRAKIVCTVGPASSPPGVLARLARAGMDVARLNASHGTHAGHARVIRSLRLLTRRTGKPIGILLDLQGPRIRVGRLAVPVSLKIGERVMLAAGQAAGTDGIRRAGGLVIPCSYRGLARDAQPGHTIFIDDGRIRLAVEETRGEKVVCRVEAGGTLTSNKGMNLPGVPLRVPTVTPKDLEDLAFGLRQGVDFVAVSFVRRGAEVAALKRRLARAGAEAPVIAKIEKPEAIDDLDAILEAADGLMVARGDLGVEFPPEKVPLLQKEIIARANAARKPVITATQMLESMISSPRPTRAEASDVANAVFDGTDAVMLSGETAAGKYPVEAVQVMDRIVREAETGLLSRMREERSDAGRTVSAAEAVTIAAARIARQSGARAIVGFSQSGLTGRLAASSRPEIPAYVFTPRADTWFRMTLCRGVVPLRLSFMANTDRLIDSAIRALKKAGRVRKGDRLVFIMGAPPSERGTTNLLKLHEA